MGVCGTKKEIKANPIDQFKSPVESICYIPNSADRARIKDLDDNFDLDLKIERRSMPIKQNLVCLKYPFSKYYTLLPQKKMIKQEEGTYRDVQDNISKVHKRLYIISKEDPFSTNILVGLKSYNLNHPHIMNFYEVFETNTEYQITSESCMDQSLQEYIDEVGQISHSEILSYFKQMAQAIQYLHSLNLTHGFLSLKSFSFVDREHKNIKLTDFSSIFNNKKQYHHNYLPFIPPEELEKENRTKSRDCWALGVILYYLFKQSFPLKSYRNYSELEQLYNQPFINLQNIDTDAHKLVSGLLNAHPTQRLKLYQALDNKCFFSHDDILGSIDHLKKVRKYALTRLQECFLQFMVNQYCAKQKQEILHIFSAQDVNKDGKICAQDIKSFFIKLYDPEEAEFLTNELIQKLELENNEQIDFHDYLLCCVDKKEIITDEKLASTFKILSTFKPRLTADQLVSRFQNISEKEIEDEIFNLTRGKQTFMRVNDFKILMSRLDQ